MQPLKINYKVYQGSTFKEIFRWESSTKVYKPITSISQNAPCQLEVIGHDIPTGWRFSISNVVGMKEINTDTQHIATAIDADTISINALNSIGYSAYTSGGIITYNAPVDLVGMTGRMQVREKLDSPTTILELTTENGGIVIDNTNKTISINITATQTAALTFSSAVYSLELVKDQVVTPFITGSLSLVKEVTR